MMEQKEEEERGRMKGSSSSNDYSVKQKEEVTRIGGEKKEVLNIKFNKIGLKSENHLLLL